MRLALARMQKPRVVALEVTTKCNLKCIYCNNTDKELKGSSSDISQSVVQRLREQSGSFDKIIICGIGESFLYSGLKELISLFGSKQFCIVTNGTVPIDFSYIGQEGNIEVIVYSLDSVDNELLNSICGSFDFDCFGNNITQHDTYNKNSNNRILKTLNCTINKYNISDLNSITRYACKNKFDAVHLSLPRGEEDLIYVKSREIYQSIEFARSATKGNSTFFVDPYEPCCVYQKWITPYVSKTGDVFLCSEALYRGNSVGNIAKTGLEDIWSSTEYSLFQKGLYCEECLFKKNGQVVLEYRSSYSS